MFMRMKMRGKVQRDSMRPCRFGYKELKTVPTSSKTSKQNFKKKKSRKKRSKKRKKLIRKK
jgi:hypothetical protein